MLSNSNITSHDYQTIQNRKTDLRDHRRNYFQPSRYLQIFPSSHSGTDRKFAYSPLPAPKSHHDNCGRKRLQKRRQSVTTGHADFRLDRSNNNGHSIRPAGFKSYISRNRQYAGLFYLWTYTLIRNTFPLLQSCKIKLNNSEKKPASRRKNSQQKSE